jgi:cytidylate kinase
MNIHIIGPAGVGVSTVARAIESSFPEDVFLLNVPDIAPPKTLAVVVVDGRLHFKGPNREWEVKDENGMFHGSQCIFLQAPLGTCLKRANKTDQEAVRRLHEEFTNSGRSFASKLTRLGAAVHHVDADRSLRPVIIDVVAHVPVLREKIRHSPQAAWMFPDNNASRLAPIQIATA